MGGADDSEASAIESPATRARVARCLLPESSWERHGELLAACTQRTEHPAPSAIHVRRSLLLLLDERRMHPQVLWADRPKRSGRSAWRIVFVSRPRCWQSRRWS